MKRVFYKLLYLLDIINNVSILRITKNNKEQLLSAYHCENVRQLKNFLWKNFKIIVIEK